MNSFPYAGALLALLVTTTAVFGAAYQPPLWSGTDGARLLAQADPDGGENGASAQEGREGMQPLDVEQEEDDSGPTNWLAWLLGVPLLAVVILLVLLFTRRGRDHDESDEENR